MTVQIPHSSNLGFAEELLTKHIDFDSAKLAKIKSYHSDSGSGAPWNTLRAVVVRLYNIVQPAEYKNSVQDPFEWAKNKHAVVLADVFVMHNLKSALERIFFEIPYYPDAILGSRMPNSLSADDHLTCWQQASMYKKYAWLMSCLVYHKVVHSTYDIGLLVASAISFKLEYEKTDNYQHTYIAIRFRDLFLSQKGASGVYEKDDARTSGDIKHAVKPSSHQSGDLVECMSGLDATVKGSLPIIFRAISLVFESWVYQTNPHLPYNKEEIAKELAASEWVKKRVCK